MNILGDRVLLERVEKDTSGGFAEVKAIDDFTSNGRIVQVGEDVEHIRLIEGAEVIFAKFSPDTHTVSIEGKEMKTVAVSDIIAIL